MISTAIDDLFADIGSGAKLLIKDATLVSIGTNLKQALKALRELQCTN
jgi:hypothetical protein